MAKDTSRTDFRAQIAAIASALRSKIESEVTGLDGSAASVAERRRRIGAPGGLEFFARTYFSHYIARPNSALHRYLYQMLPEAIEGERGALEVVEAPRGEAKSTICSQILHLWCIARSLKHFQLIIMDTYEQAAIMLEAVKAELEFNPRLTMDFPEICGEGPAWREGVAITTSGVKLQARGAGQRLRGMRHGPHRPDLVTLDDLENDENSRSPEQRDRLESWIDKVVLNLGQAGGKLDVIYVGTVIHYDSVLARKENNPAWHARKFKAVIRWPDRMDMWERWEELYRNDGRATAEAYFGRHLAEMVAGAEVSWPEVRPIGVLMEIRVRVGHAAFDSEYQNDPVSEEGAIFKDITFWVERLSEWVFLGACDPSLGRKNKARDPSAIGIGGLNRETGILDVVEASITRRVPDKIIEDIIAFQKEYRCVRWFVEAVQFQEFLYTELLKRSVQRRIPVPAVPIVPDTDKDLRIQSIQPYTANGYIRFHPSQLVLLDQLRHYPMADHDDGPDMLEMLWKGAMTLSGSLDYGSSGVRRESSTGLSGFLPSMPGGSGRRDLSGF